MEISPCFGGKCYVNADLQSKKAVSANLLNKQLLS